MFDTIQTIADGRGIIAKIAGKGVTVNDALPNNVTFTPGRRRAKTAAACARKTVFPAGHAARAEMLMTTWCAE